VVLTVLTKASEARPLTNTLEQPCWKLPVSSV
jgi:hypothetical protein